MDQNRVAAGPLEEAGARPPGPVEDPIFEASRARASEQGQSTGPLLSVQEEPISKLGTESEMPEEVSAPDQPDHRNPEIQFPVSRPLDRASEKRSSQDHGPLTDQVRVSTVVENSSLKDQVEYGSSREDSHHDPWLKAEVPAQGAEEPAPV